MQTAPSPPELLKVGGDYLAKFGDFVTLPLYVMAGVLKDDLERIDRTANVDFQLPDPNYCVPAYEATETWMSRMRTNPDVARCVVNAWWSHLISFMGSVQLQHEITQEKGFALRQHTELLSVFCDLELTIDTAVLWRFMQAAIDFENVHHSYREDANRNEKRDYYIRKLANAWASYAGIVEDAESLKTRIINAIEIRQLVERPESSLFAERVVGSQNVVYHDLLIDHDTAEGLTNQARDQILFGTVERITGQSNQIWRDLDQRDHGIDGEIEFRDRNGNATGKKICVQLKYGDSHLRARKGDGKQVFDVKNPRHLTYWKSQLCDVYLVVESSDGKLHWMNLSQYLRRRRDKTSRQIVFDGQPLDISALIKLRDKFLGYESKY